MVTPTLRDGPERLQTGLASNPNFVSGLLVPYQKSVDINYDDIMGLCIVVLNKFTPQDNVK